MSLGVLIITLIFNKMIFDSGNNIHSEMIKGVLNAPINLFFDVTPTGVIINRFSKDLENVTYAFWGFRELFT